MTSPPLQRGAPFFPFCHDLESTETVMGAGNSRKRVSQVKGGMAAFTPHAAKTKTHYTRSSRHKELNLVP